MTARSSLGDETTTASALSLAPNSGFVAVAGGCRHSLGLKADGSIVGWGYNVDGRCDAPSPNSGFMAIAAGENHSLGLKAISGDLDHDGHVETDDWNLLADCWSGPDGVPAGGCFPADFEGDTDTDLADFALFQRAFLGL
jgi:hypothetical protein